MIKLQIKSHRLPLAVRNSYPVIVVLLKLYPTCSKFKPPVLCCSGSGFKMYLHIIVKLKDKKMFRAKY